MCYGTKKDQSDLDLARTGLVGGVGSGVISWVVILGELSA